MRISMIFIPQAFRTPTCILQASSICHRKDTGSCIPRVLRLSRSITHHFTMHVTNSSVQASAVFSVLSAVNQCLFQQLRSARCAINPFILIDRPTDGLQTKCAYLISFLFRRFVSRPETGGLHYSPPSIPFFPILLPFPYSFFQFLMVVLRFLLLLVLLLVILLFFLVFHQLDLGLLFILHHCLFLHHSFSISLYTSSSSSSSYSYFFQLPHRVTLTHKAPLS